MSDESELTTDKYEALIAQAQYQQHPYGKVWQKFDLGDFSELVSNIQNRGLDQDILLYQGKILEGWHRYLACLHTSTPPRFSEFEGTDLEAAERVHASGVRRSSSPDQRYAAFLLLGEACLEFKEKYEQLKQKGIEQKGAGIPLSTDVQRVDVVGTKAAAAGVSRATASKVEKVKRENPSAVSDIAAGNISANKALKMSRSEPEILMSDSSLKYDEPNSVESDSSDQPEHDDFEPNTVMFQGRLVDELRNAIKLCDSIIQQLSQLDWTKESRNEWSEAKASLQNVMDAISREVKGGFENSSPKGKKNSKKKPPKKKPTPQSESSTITIRKLNSQYGTHSVDVLSEYLDELPQKEGEVRSYNILKPLPSDEEFSDLQRQKYTLSAAELVDSAFGELEDLANEMGEWYDNMPPQFQDGDKGSAIDDARGTLESLSNPELNKDIGNLRVYYLPLMDTRSRAQRRDDAVGKLQAVVDALEESEANGQPLIDELQDSISEVESVEFPGMFG